MGKYIHKFETTNELNAEYNGFDYKQPWVSYTVENDQMNYDQLSKEYLLKANKPLCITTATSNTTKIYITFGISAEYCYIYNRPLEIEYSLNNGSSWNKIEFSLENQENFDEIDENTLGVPIYTTSIKNTSVLLRANFETCGFYDWHEINSGIVIGATNPCYVSGNPSSLLRSKNFDQIVALPECAFAYLFSNGSWVLIDPENPIILPTEKAPYGCYSHMFQNCTSLEYAPELPATMLENSCYSYMFDGCSNLTTVFDLPAVSLPGACYQFMFGNCTSLVNAPDIFATTNTCTVAEAGACSYMFYNCSSLVNPPKFRMLNLKGEMTQNGPGDSVYSGMFEGCSSLVTAPELPATTVSAYCYQGMFKNCTSLINAPELPATTIDYSCYSGMFEGCTSLITAPELLATTLQYYCYREMFKNCSNLNYIKCLAVDNINKNGSTTDWVNGVSATGTFVQNPSADWPTGINGIPSGWTYNKFRLDKTEYIVDLQGETIHVTGNSTLSSNWSFVNNESWITSNISSYSPGNISFDLIIAATNSQRTATVYLECENVSIPITITQKQITNAYSINLNGEWTTWGKYNNNQTYASTNYHQDDSDATMIITIKGCNTFDIYAQCNSEKDCDELYIYDLDSTTSKKYEISGTSYFSKYTFTNIGGGTHTIKLTYSKDASDYEGSDRAEIYIPSTYTLLT